MKYDIITILGPTATGKTTFATHLAHAIDAEIISADSRQVYRGMDIGTGKDIAEYQINGQPIEYHLINIVDAGYKYNVFEFQRDFLEVFNTLKKSDKNMILCGGTGMYLESVLKGYKLVPVEPNAELRKELEKNTLDELRDILASYKKLHATTDIDTKKRAIRAIEIEQYYENNPLFDDYFPKINSIIFGINFSRDLRRSKITERLDARLNEGLIEEVEYLLNNGVSVELMMHYGLEYKFAANYLLGNLTREKMRTLLNTAIHQFAKRQMTWFRRMEKSGFQINWIDGELPMEDKINVALELLQ